MIDNLKKSWSVEYKMRIDSNVDDLWNVITKPGHLEMVHPFCKENYPIVWDKENSKDVSLAVNGGIVEVLDNKVSALIEK